MKVKIRPAMAVKAVDLCEVPYGTDLEKVISMLREWGVETEYGDDEELMGQFVVAPGEAYFEIVVGDD